MNSYGKILQLDTAGSFDFFTCVISLDIVDPRSLQKLRAEEKTREAGTPYTMHDFVARDPIMPLVAHEYTHFVDATSTCWGLNHLLLLNGAYQAHQSRVEDQFFRYKVLDNHMRGLRVPAYYRTVAKNTPATRRWGYYFTAGRRFTAAGHLKDAPPIIFCNFTTEDRKFLARSPISALSLLETSAMAQELLTRMSVLAEVAGEEANVEKVMQVEKILKYLYDHTITEYSVCAHVVANIQQCSDILLGYSLAGMLSRFSLDFPRAAFEPLSATPLLPVLFGVPDGDPSVQLIREGLRLGDRGILYYVLAHALPKGATDSIAVMGGALRYAVERLGLRMEALREWTLEEGRLLELQVRQGPSEGLRALANAGVQNQAAISQSAIRLDFNSLQVPQALLGDCESHAIYDSDHNVLGRVSSEQFFNELNFLERATADFSEACI
ncbi:hypothetical protein [Stenotrophomonas maltophilia]|uniref:hypothetical protein n=1 Tax=Stenotrophomonas maltophilia TaxID=40324 RepID=UPI00240D6F24|nr:hypothetical protein [Stenotrophomonas maltophilia]MDG2509376.1 hypothetical protein [Stenotrophomonas maltophilia]